ncbi:MAG: multidrug DMT transporter [Bacillota bacterium]|nr:multidrug DMT transporter [Bacillota bacterium]
MDNFEKKRPEIHERVLGKALTNEEENNYTENMFESIKHINKYGEEFWYARELQIALEYKQWRRFKEVIDRAIIACKNSENTISEHFADIGKTSPMPNGGERIIDDYELSRYACYLIVQNGDARKKVIALGQTYFAIKTRQQELIENFDELSEDQKRLAIRQQMAEHNLDVFKNPYKYCVKRVFCIFYVTYNFTLISFNIWFSIKMIQYFLPRSNWGDVIKVS